ncbi:DUF692 domain-containing protein [Afifella sp. IM 167]|uniref:MNIO family bufferin maturase n=1 Tax=Afifella sp. IM 167 TaxID=2033586 RepID=UPI001CCACB8A|nr:DUF692 domain-containing protein [Afifella sp. IM 167]MBZ8132726.1 hypothetical protein [Afifella sp. IM 167]
MPLSPRSEPALAARLPERAGVGLKLDHVKQILEEKSEIGFFEVHPENYMGAGGPPHHYLSAIRERYPLSLHGVGLSIGGAGRLDGAHLQKLRALLDRYQPQSFSEHLAWSTHEGHFLNDLLPLPYTQETLRLVAAHVEEAQERLGRKILIENPSTYVAFSASDMDEVDFLAELAGRTGCGLLLDVNNVYVSATNHAYSPEAYLDRFPVHLVGEIHLAGHAVDEDESGAPLLVDTHDRSVTDAVWTLYERVIARVGPVPTLVEWDSELPDWPVLAAEAARAEAILFSAGEGRDARRAAS